MNDYRQQNVLIWQASAMYMARHSDISRKGNDENLNRNVLSPLDISPVFVSASLYVLSRQIKSLLRFNPSNKVNHVGVFVYIVV